MMAKLYKETAMIVHVEISLMGCIAQIQPIGDKTRSYPPLQSILRLNEGISNFCGHRLASNAVEGFAIWDQMDWRNDAERAWEGSISARMEPKAAFTPSSP